MSPGRNFTMSPDQVRERAEKSFKKEERARDGRAAMQQEYDVEAVAVRAKTVRLKALRLAKEAQALIEAPPAKPIKQPTKRRVRASRTSSLFELSGSASLAPTSRHGCRRAF